MNFLAHQFLSFGDESLMIGNFIADSVKGNKLFEYPEAVQKGITLHRVIDTFTDTHPLVLQTRAHLHPYFHKYAGVVQDVFYDHFLALSWKKYHPQSLESFSGHVYQVLGENVDLMNERAARTFHFMQLHDWLGNYSTREGIDRTLKGMASRTKFPSNMENSMEALNLHFDEMVAEFDAFFPQLIRAARAAAGLDALGSGRL